METPRLEAGFSFGSIVNIRSSTNLDYIEPGLPDSSYLILKVEGKANARMPLNRAPLPAAQIQLLRDWVCQGALEDDLGVDGGCDSSGSGDPDDDGDGVSNDNDDFPDDPNETRDTDGDGVGNNADAFDNDPSETMDSDGDGVGNNADVFPDDATETADADGDGTGNVADTDDDNDGLSDTFENDNGLDPLDDADADIDTDGDGINNIVEFENGTDINDANDAGDACELGNSQDELTSSLTNETRVFVANPGSNSNQQTFLRFVNDNNMSTDVEVYGIDDSGVRSKKGPMTFTLNANESKQITAQDVENGNDNKGLGRNLCNGQGKWQLVVRSANPVKVMGLIRTPDGFLTSLNDVVTEAGSDNIVYFANPGSNSKQQTFLRIVNRSTDSGSVTITAIDDTGAASVGTISFDLTASESKQLTAQDLENGNGNKGLTGNLDNGAGKWRLTVSSTLDLEVMSMIRSEDGFLTNLSGMVDAAASDHIIYFANPASDTFRQTFLRIINTSDTVGTVTIAGVDDSGDIAPNGDVMFDLNAGQSKQMTAQDLENGNLDKGLQGMLGAGDGRWRLTVSSTLSLEVMSLVRTPDGFLTNLSRTTPVSGGVNEVWLFNPASNVNQKSTLRLVNNDSTQGSVTISARYWHSGTEWRGDLQHCW